MRFPTRLPESLPDRLTTHRLAKLLGVCHSTIHNWTRAGLLPPPIRKSSRLYLHDTRLVRRALVNRVMGARDALAPLAEDAAAPPQALSESADATPEAP